MAVNPIANLREMLAAQATGADTDTAKKTRVFEQLLDSSLAQGQPLSGDQARHLAALVKLEMMAGLIAWDDNGKRDTSSFFASLPPVPPANPAVARQKFSLMSENRPVATAAPRLTHSTESKPASTIEQLVDKAAQRYQVAPELIKAVIKAESSFNPRAQSPAGAQGLMQLMPATARELGVEDSFDPEQNIMGGTRYLRDLLKRYDGNLDQALAAYNWGMGNLARSDGRLPEETRNYQIRVKQYLTEFSGKRSA